MSFTQIGDAGRDRPAADSRGRADACEADLLESGARACGTTAPGNARILVKSGIAIGAALLAAVAGATAAFARQDAGPADAPAAALDVIGIDHVGINVPDAGKAAQFFHDLIDTRIVSDWRPAPVDRQWKRRFRWHSGARLTRLMMIEARDGSKMELFEYASPDASRKQPHEDDASATHIAFKAHDPARALATIRAMGLPVLNAPLSLPDGSRWFYFLSPWGSQIELVFPPDP